MHYRLLKESHDQLGHKGFYVTRYTLGDCFWQPTINMDVQQIVSMCHQYQILSFKQVVLPPTVQTPAPLFRKAYIDMLHMPPLLGNHSEVITLKLVDSPRSQFEIQVKQIYNILLVYILHQMITWAVTCTWISNHNCLKYRQKASYCMTQTGEARNDGNAIYNLSIGH